MRLFVLIAAVLCSACVGSAAGPPAPIRSFDLPPPPMEPGAAAWRVRGESLRGYAIHLDQMVPWNRHATWHLTHAGAPANERAWMSCGVPAGPYVGKHVRIDVDVRTQGPPGEYDLWARVRKLDGHAAGARTPIDPIAEFRHASLVLDVPADAATIEFGPRVTSPAELWVAESSVTVVDASVPVAPPSTW